MRRPGSGLKREVGARSAGRKRKRPEPGEGGDESPEQRVARRQLQDDPSTGPHEHRRLGPLA